MLNTYQDRGFDRSSIYSTAFIPAKNTLFSSRQMDRQHFNYRSSSLALKAIGSQRNNHKPVNLQISKTQVYENALVNSLVGKLITVDRDQKKNFRYKLIPIRGSEDHTVFKIVRDQLQLKTLIDFETQASYKIKIRTTDQGSLFLNKTLMIQVIDVLENPLPPPPPGSLLGSQIDLSKVLRLEQWRSTMEKRALQVYGALTDPTASFDQKLAETYYDAEGVFTKIAEYLKDPKYYTYAQAAGDVYQKYVLDNNGGVPGYWNFTSGLTKRYLRTGDLNAKKAVQLLANNAAFARDSDPLAWSQSYEVSREVANAIESYINAERVGEPRRWRLGDLVNQALGHLDQWFGAKTASYIKAFMVGLTANALIDYQEQTGDSRIVGALTQALDGLWQSNWDAGAQAFKYVDRAFGTNPDTNNTQSAPDLNLIIAPAYGWLYLKTGEVRFKERGDQIFNGGVQNAWTNDGKHFNQNYQWSFDYIKWRTEGQIKWNN